MILNSRKADRWVAIVTEFSRFIADHLGSHGLPVKCDGLYAVSPNSLLLISRENDILACFRISDFGSIRWRADWLPVEEIGVFQALKWPSSCGKLGVIAGQYRKAALEKSVKGRQLPDQERSWVAKIDNLDKLPDLMKIDLAGNPPTRKRKASIGETFRGTARSAPLMAAAANKSVDDFLAVGRQGEKGESVLVFMGQLSVCVSEKDESVSKLPTVLASPLREQLARWMKSGSGLEIFPDPPCA